MKRKFNLYMAYFKLIIQDMYKYISSFNWKPIEIVCVFVIAPFASPVRGNQCNLSSQMLMN